MTLRRLWLLILVLVTLIAIAVNTLILTFLTDQYFSDYLNESYDLHVNQIIDYTSTALITDNLSYEQMAIELEAHLSDPIIGIKLYKPAGELIIEVNSNYHIDGSMIDNMMGSRFMMGNNDAISSEEVHQYDIVSDNQVIAIMNISIHSIAENSFVARRFKGALLFNSLYSVAITIGIAILVGIFISHKMSKALKDTESLASDIQLGKETILKPTGIKEVNSIRDSLMELNGRLRLKQKTRQSLVDQLVHQTRTPLTILQSHIEAIEDGIIEANEKELQVFQNQISDIKSIISNMSSMIDAEKDSDELKIETFDIGTMLKQIQQGLMAQYRKKNVDLNLSSTQVIKITTDKYKLSQSIYNLLTNAYKYTDGNGQVKISYIMVDQRLIIKVQDTGIGIASKDLKKIFNAYYRSQQTLSEKGDGIGLYIVKENIEQIGGYVNVESKVDYGSTFTIDIPIKLEKE